MCGVEFNKENRIWGRRMVDGRTTAFRSFSCPKCQALYQIVKVEAGPESDFQDVPCPVCGEAFVGHEDNFVVKYFLLREATRVQKWRRLEKRQPASASGRR
jgi:hypothetical protein